MLIAENAAVVPNNFIVSALDDAVTAKRGVTLHDSVTGVDDDYARILSANLYATGSSEGIDPLPLFTEFPNVDYYSSWTGFRTLWHYLTGARSRSLHGVTDLHEVTLYSVSAAKSQFKDTLLATVHSPFTWTAPQRVYIQNAVLTGIIDLSDTTIPVKDNAFSITHILGDRIREYITSVRDVLRFAEAVNKIDSKKIFNLRNADRKVVIQALDALADKQGLKNLLSDAARNKAELKALLRSLHVGPENKNVNSINHHLWVNSSWVKNSLAPENVRSVDDLKRLAAIAPGVFARNFHRFYSDATLSDVCVPALESAAPNIPGKILWRIAEEAILSDESRVVVTRKGAVKSLPARETDASLIVDKLCEIAVNNTPVRYKDVSVYIDPSLQYRGIPVGNDSSPLNNAGRFDVIPIPAGINAVRAFAFWEEKEGGSRSDLDLAGSIIHTNGSSSTVSWNSYYSNNGVSFSGDLTSAPYGRAAAEYIDVDLTLVSKDTEYIVGSIYRYSGPDMQDLERVVTGVTTDTLSPVSPNGTELVSLDLKAGHFTSNALLWAIDVPRRQIVLLGTHGSRNVHFQSARDSRVLSSKSFFDTIRARNESRVNLDTIVGASLGEGVVVVSNPDDADVKIGYHEALSLLS